MTDQNTRLTFCLISTRLKLSVKLCVKAKIISYTPEPERVAALAYRQCRSEEGVDKLSDRLDKPQIEKYVRKAIEDGHTSVLEHASFTFLVEGISRVCTHQLVRHRIASYSQQSHRYVKKVTYVTPPSWTEKPRLLQELVDLRSRGESLFKRAVEDGVPVEDARAALLEYRETKIVVTMNARELLVSFFPLRCCINAQWEIRGLAWLMLKEVRKVAPTIFERNPCDFCQDGKCIIKQARRR